MNRQTIVGIIGAGRIGQAVARVALRASRGVVLSNRTGGDSLQLVVEELGAGVRAGTIAEAAAQPIVVVAVPWASLGSALTGLTSFEGRIVVDATNALTTPDYRAVDLGGRASTEVVATMVPGARVVKAFNTLLAAVLASDPNQAGGRRVLFYSGDDESAKRDFNQLITAAGFAGIDLGGLAASKVQQFPDGSLAAINLVQLP